MHRHVRVPALFPRRRCWQDTGNSKRQSGLDLPRYERRQQCSLLSIQQPHTPRVDAMGVSMDALVPACSPWASFSGAKGSSAHAPARARNVMLIGTPTPLTPIGKEIGRSASGGNRPSLSLLFAFARDAPAFG